eukprot:630369-Rhodomonas_salina.2
MPAAIPPYTSAILTETSAIASETYAAAAGTSPAQQADKADRPATKHQMSTAAACVRHMPGSRSATDTRAREKSACGVWTCAGGGIPGMPIPMPICIPGGSPPTPGIMPGCIPGGPMPGGAMGGACREERAASASRRRSGVRDGERRRR